MAEQRQLDFDNRAGAALRRDLGVERTAARAERRLPGWLEIALGYLQAFAATRQRFMTEELRAWAIAEGCPAPPNPKAWGAVMQAGRRRGIIRSIGYAPAASSNLSPKVLWAAGEPK